MTPCSHPDCQRNVYVRGLCRPHAYAGTKCIICHNKQYARGLCQMCWRAAKLQIKIGNTTDKKLVKKGLWLPIPRHYRSRFVKAMNATSGEAQT